MTKKREENKEYLEGIKMGEEEMKTLVGQQLTNCKAIKKMIKINGRKSWERNGARQQQRRESDFDNVQITQHDCIQ